MGGGSHNVRMIERRGDAAVLPAQERGKSMRRSPSRELLHARQAAALGCSASATRPKRPRTTSAPRCYVATLDARCISCSRRPPPASNHPSAPRSKSLPTPPMPPAHRRRCRQEAAHQLTGCSAPTRLRSARARVAWTGPSGRQHRQRHQQRHRQRRTCHDSRRPPRSAPSNACHDDRCCST